MLALWGLGYYTLGWAGRGHMTAAMAGWGLFLLVETAPMLWTMLAFAGAMLFLSRIFPPAAIIFLIIGIVFFILRIRYVIQNAQLLASGFLVYLVYYYLFADHMRLGGKLVEVCYRLLTLGHLIVPPLAPPAAAGLSHPAPGRRAAGTPGPSVSLDGLPERV